MTPINLREDIGEAQVNEAALIQMFTALATNAICIAGEDAVFNALATVVDMRPAVSKLAANIKRSQGNPGLDEALNMGDGSYKP